MIKGMTFMERVQENSLHIVSETTELIKEGLLDKTLKSIAMDIEAIYPESKYSVEDGCITIMHLARPITSFVCGIATADNDHNFNLSIEDKKLHLKLNKTVKPGTELILWIMLGKVIQQYRKIMENPFLTSSDDLLIDLTSY